MAAKNPRIMVTLDGHKYAVIKRLAELQGISMSKVISGLVDVVIEPLERMAHNLEVLSLSEENFKVGFKESIDSALDELEDLTQKALKAHDMFQDEFEKMVREKSSLIDCRGSELAAKNDDVRRISERRASKRKT